jgi:hypothetical protein
VVDGGPLHQMLRRIVIHRFYVYPLNGEPGGAIAVRRGTEKHGDCSLALPKHICPHPSKTP